MSRTWLFVPGDRPERFAKAIASGAHRVILDLEDAVAPDAKPAARRAVAQFVATAATPVALRINAVDHPGFAEDLALLAAPSIAAVIVPKADDPAVLARVAACRAGLAVVPLVESAAGFAAVRRLAATPAVERLAFGHIDFQLDLGLVGAEEADLLPYRTELVLASRLAGIAAPLDGVTVALDDTARLTDDARRARRLGFGGKLCIHPRQIAPVREAFRPAAAELAWARRVLAAGAEGAAVQVDGAMVDRPVLLRARAIVQDADAG